MNVAEAENRYADYQRGWKDGVLYPHPMQRLGAPEPRYRDEYDRGYEDGRRAFQEAMSTLFKAFRQRLMEQTDPKNRPSLRQVTRVEDCHACGKPATAVGEDGSFTCGSHECDKVGVLYTPFVLVSEQPMRTATEIRIEDGKLTADGVEVKGVVEEVVLATANLDGIKKLELTSCTCGEDDDDGPSLPHKTWCPKAGEW
jgi:hypothetical protein